MDVLILGLLLSGAYALVAMGLTLQYGVARIMNLASGEILIFGALAAFLAFQSAEISPILTLLIVAPVAFGLNWLVYRALMAPLVRRSKGGGRLEVDSILATFGIGFILVGVATEIHGEFYAYSFLADPVALFGVTTGWNRLVAFGFAAGLGAALYLWLNHTRSGSAMRAVAVNPEAASLVGVNVPSVSAYAFALGGAVTAAGGVLISTFVTLDAGQSVAFTMKALIIVIMGGVGDLRGAIVAALILGLVETAVATWVAPGLTLAAAYLIFLTTLLLRPQGLFGRRPA